MLLDDDKSGNFEMERYISGWHLPKSLVFTLQSISTEFAGKSLETLLGSETFELVGSNLGISKKPSKKQLGWYLAEQCASTSEQKIALPTNAIENLTKVLDFLEQKFSLNIIE